MAILRRNFLAYFGSPTGYVFITIFLAATAFLAFNSATFFANNLADFSALNAVFHWLPLVFVPAITMTVWAEERKAGTDELLLTLPVRDIEVVLGKYLACLGVYTVTLVFALSHALVLAYLGDPDWGLIAANFIGYWLVGAALIPLGMIASFLTANVTVAFILGTVLCLAAVFAEEAVALALGGDSRLAEGVGVKAHFRNFTLGVISLPDALYFALLGISALYVNMVLLGRRHWLGGKNGPDMWWHYLVRGASVVVAAVAISVLAGRWLDAARVDATAEGLNSISEETRRLLKDIPGERPVYIQAYVSPEVPEPYVKARQDLLRMLRQFDAMGGDRILVTVHETELHSDAAREAAERFNIRPQRVMTMAEGRMGTQEVFMGVALTSGPQEQVIPFMDRGLPVEYELVRSVRVVAEGDRPKIGILRTDAKLFGGFDFQTMNMAQPWPIVEELRKQYEVVQAEPGQPLDEDIAVLVAALPSSLTQPQMDMLAEQIQKGTPTLLLVDPLPIRFPQLAPSQPRRPPGGMMGRQQQPPEPKGDLEALLSGIGVDWKKDVIIWDAYNPLPKVLELAEEIIFVSPQSGGKRAFNPKDEVTKDLNRVVLMFPGTIDRVPGTPNEFDPLLTTGPTSGELHYSGIISMSFMGMSINPRRRHVVSPDEYILAARITGKSPEKKPAAEDEEGDEKKEGEEQKAEPRGTSAIVVADLDLIGEEFFQMRNQGDRELDFDNITFLLNCVDSLAYDQSLIALRNRRPLYRTLKTIEERRKKFQTAMLQEEKSAEADADEALSDAQQRLDDKLAALRKRTDIDERTRNIMLENLRQVEQNRFDIAKAAVEQKKEDRTQRAKEQMYRGVRRIETRVRFWTVLLPPLPALLIGLCVLVVQAVLSWLETSVTRVA